MTNISVYLLLGFIVSVLINLFLVYKLSTKKEAASLPNDTSNIDFAISDVVKDPKTLLLQAIYEANRTLDIAMYHFADQDIAKAVLDVHARGVNVRILTDAKKAQKISRAKILDAFAANEIEIKTNSLRKMHLKMTIIDEQLIITGSYNFTKASADQNIEQLVTITNAELAKKWTQAFEVLWNRHDFKSWE